RNAAILAQLVHGDDVRMLQPRGRLGLDLEALEVLLLEQPLASERLDRCLALERLVEPAVDHAHAAAPEPADDAVAANAYLLARVARRCGRVGTRGAPRQALLQELKQDNRDVVLAA